MKVGSVVRLKSETDTQKMIVDKISGDTVRCFWRDKSSLVRYGTFPKTSLVLLVA